MDVVFWEGPVFGTPDAPARLTLEVDSSGVTVTTPQLPVGLTGKRVEQALRRLINN